MISSGLFPVSQLCETLTVAFWDSSVPDAYAPSLANPAKRTAVPKSSEEKTPGGDSVMFYYIAYTSPKQAVILRKWETLVGLAWSLAQSYDDG